MRHYIGLIRKEKDSCYGVDFPDFPGCITAADTVEEAQARAVEVLDFHVDGMIEDGEPLPEALGLDQILEDPGNRNGLVLAVQVPLADKKSKKVRVDITIPEDVSRQVDRFVKNTEGINRSSFFASAGLEKLQRVTAHHVVPIIQAGQKRWTVKRSGTTKTPTRMVKKGISPSEVSGEMVRGREVIVKTSRGGKAGSAKTHVAIRASKRATTKGSKRTKVTK